MTTLDYIVQKFNLDIHGKQPTQILKINRTIMAQTLAELGFSLGAEIGIARGKHATVLHENIPGLKLYCVDPWKAWPGYVDYSQARLDKFYQDALVNLKPYNCIIVKKPSVEAAQDIRDRSLDFVYLDAAHDFVNVTLDIANWSRKIRKGGILFGHDFKRSTNPRCVHHVMDVVQAWAYSHHITPWFVLGEKGHHDNVYREGTRSWMWIV